MPKYNPKDYEPKDFIEIPEGDYSFSVVNATENTSSKDNEMIELEMQFDVGRSAPMIVYDRLVFTKKALFRIEGFCVATGHDFSKGELLAGDCIGTTGIAHLGLGAPREKGKHAGKRFMEIRWYCRPKGYEESPVQPEQEALSAQTEDDIPF